MRIAFISTISPRECGIASFTDNLMPSMLNSDSARSHTGIAIAMNEPGMEYEYPEEVKFVIHEEIKEDYIKAAEFINKNADLCMLQHEFNIFGGTDGTYILMLVKELKIPLAANFHTVLQHPTASKRYILQEISKKAQKVIVMSQTALDFCLNVYDIPKKKLAVINHGIPDIHTSLTEARKKLNLPLDNKIIISFGLLTENKGIEIALQALPPVIENHPEVKYLILGKTHPALKKAKGEEYRNWLEKLTQKLNLQKHVFFINKFISNSDLNLYLAATDILITSYKDKDQISSGVLTFAMGAHTAVVSTPFWNAMEILADGRGKLFDFNNSDRLSEILNDLLDHPQKMKEIKLRAYQFGKEITWSKIGPKYVRLAESIIKQLATHAGAGSSV